MKKLLDIDEPTYEQAMLARKLIMNYLKQNHDTYGDLDEQTPETVVYLALKFWQ